MAASVETEIKQKRSRKYKGVLMGCIITAVIVGLVVLVAVAFFLMGTLTCSNMKEQNTAELTCFQCATYNNTRPSSNYTRESDCGEDPKSVVLCKQGEVCAVIYRETHAAGNAGHKIERFCHPRRKMMCTKEIKQNGNIFSVAIACFCDTSLCVPFTTNV